MGLKTPILRDRAYLTALRDMPCILTGQYGTDNDAVDPCHIGTAGKGMKSPDNEVLPILHSLHVKGHQSGEVSMLREHAPDWLLRAMARAYAREAYNVWREGRV